MPLPKNGEKKKWSWLSHMWSVNIHTHFGISWVVTSFDSYIHLSNKSLLQTEDIWKSDTEKKAIYRVLAVGMCAAHGWETEKVLLPGTYGRFCAVNELNLP